MENIKYPYIWGPYYWNLLHAVTLLYPDNPSNTDKLMMRNFFYSYIFLLPCQKCKDHFHHILSNFIIECNSKKEMFIIGFKIHNIVNESLKKKVLNDNEIDKIIKKYNNTNIKNILGNVLSYSINNIISITPIIENSLKNLLDSMNYFLQYKKKNLNIEFEKSALKYNSKLSLLKLVNLLKN
jgi:hypothetical protein